MVYNGTKYFVVANTQSLNGVTEYSQTDAKNMCSNETAQIVARPENTNQTEAILAFLQPIAAKVGHRIHAWAACSGELCGAYAVRIKNKKAGIGGFKDQKEDNANAFLALCERGESSINTILGPCDST